jgi:hypothetical protein
MAYLNRALTGFRTAVNAKFPTRDKASDGWIGDPAHQATDSDHNPDRDGSVDAWDMDTDLRSGDDAVEVENLKHVFQAHPSSRYWIHNRKVASRSGGWKPEPYYGKNPHDKHVHWNTREGYEDSTAPWILTKEDSDMPTVDEVWAKSFAEYVDENGNAVRDKRTVADVLYAAHRNSVLALDKATEAAETATKNAATLARIESKLEGI